MATHVHATLTIVTKVRFGRRRLVASVSETMLIPASDGLIHHLRVTFKPHLRDEREHRPAIEKDPQA